VTGSSPVGLDLAALQRFFARQIPGADRLAGAELVSGGRSNLTYLVTDGRSQWILRRPPLGGLTPSAHDMGREYRVVAALSSTAVPVAPAVALCEDTRVLGVPFSIVEFVPGGVIRTQDDLAIHDNEAVTRCGHALVDTLAALHAVPYAEIGLAGFGRPRGYLARQVSRWRDQWTRVATRKLADVEALHAWLASQVPPESGASIVHGDFRIDNVILDDDIATVRAVVDWEMATLGDPLADLGLHLVYRDPAFGPVVFGSAAAVSSRLPTTDALAGRYAAASGRDLGRLDYYLALGYFKIAVIAEGIHARHLAGQTLGEGFDTVGTAVPELAAAGLRALARRSWS
jgi:aminoglycoside phosphotransferase (APT) family kinase protein